MDVPAVFNDSMTTQRYVAHRMKTFSIITHPQPTTHIDLLRDL